MAKTYQELGASASKAGLHQVLKATKLETDHRYFASLIPDLAGDPNYQAFIHCDGAGTKSIVAYLHYRETGDTSLFKNLAYDALVMNLDDAFCLGPVSGLAYANMIGRNARLVPDSAIQQILEGYKELVDLLAKHDIKITLAGGETADCGDTVRTLMVDGVLAGRIEKNKLIDTTRIAPGDVIIGLASNGKTTFEAEENSGIGSNGLTLARHSLISRQYADKYPEILDAGVTSEKRYSGRGAISDPLPETTLTIAKALSSPTRTFALALNQIYQSDLAEIHAVIHTTGGGATKVLRFGPPGGMHFIKDNLFPTPAIFELIQSQAQVPWEEMYQVFNMGTRLEIYAPERVAARVIGAAQAFKINAQVIGRVEKSSTGINQVSVKSKYGAFNYTLS
ncbi:phosphoribosylformylglycinamidine cyclo-ligase [bacterium]|nr:phosphoribosylformylglycinamidine cyclo-ligase [bacterium]